MGQDMSTTHTPQYTVASLIQQKSNAITTHPTKLPPTGGECCTNIHTGHMLQARLLTFANLSFKAANLSHR